MRDWEANGSDTHIDSRVMQEVDRRLKEASHMEDFNRFTID